MIQYLAFFAVRKNSGYQKREICPMKNEGAGRCLSGAVSERNLCFSVAKAGKPEVYKKKHEPGFGKERRS